MLTGRYPLEGTMVNRACDVTTSYAPDGATISHEGFVLPEFTIAGESIAQANTRFERCIDEACKGYKVDHVRVFHRGPAQCFNPNGDAFIMIAMAVHTTKKGWLPVESMEFVVEVIKYEHPKLVLGKPEGKRNG